MEIGKELYAPTSGVMLTSCGRHKKVRWQPFGVQCSSSHAPMDSASSCQQWCTSQPSGRQISPCTYLTIGFSTAPQVGT
eukprot:13932189-Ditylum_brightwellii.AAC.1